MSSNLTLEEQATNFHTLTHIQLVNKLINICVVELLRRGERHDQTKLDHPEVEEFVKHAPALAGTTFGSEEDAAIKKKMEKALQHHYAHNRHHPEHFKYGVNGMNLLDVVEMLCDWKASSTRHTDGNIHKLIEFNVNRFGISPQLVRIMENTLELFD